MTHETFAVRWPDQFFDPAILSQAYAPLLAEAQHTLRNLFPTHKLAAYSWFERKQPAFILLPLIYLYISQELGPHGITSQHTKLLPQLLLAMEICAILDDCVDQTPMRSGEPSFYQHNGLVVTPSMISTLVSKSLSAQREYPEVYELAAHLYAELGEREMWEHQHRYPAPDIFQQWLQNRYTEARIAGSHAIIVTG